MYEYRGKSFLTKMIVNNDDEIVDKNNPNANCKNSW